MGLRICESLGCTKFHLTVTFTQIITMRSPNCYLASSVDLCAHFGTPHGSFMSNLKDSLLFAANFAKIAVFAHTVPLRSPKCDYLTSPDQYASFDTQQV